MNNWTEIKIAVSAADIDKAGDIANVVVPYGIYIEDYRDMEQVVQDIAHIDLIDEDLLKKDRSKAFVHLYLEPGVSPAEAVAFLSERYESEGIAHSIELLDCAEEDWRNNWKQYFHPLAVGKNLMIVPSWYENFDAQGRTVLNIDPGLAFGTGGHETTRLCLEMCEKYMKRGDAKRRRRPLYRCMRKLYRQGKRKIRHCSCQHRSGRYTLFVKGHFRLYEARRGVYNERNHRHPSR